MTEHSGAAFAVRVAPDRLTPETLRAAIESSVLREGTDYGLHEHSFDDTVARLAPLHPGGASIVFDPPAESASLVVAGAFDALAP